MHEARNDTYKRLAKIAGGGGVDEKAIYSLLEISDKPGADGSLNSGNKVTDDIKLQVKVSCFDVCRSCTDHRRPIDSLVSM